MGVADIVKVVPPEVVRYILLKPDLQENIDIDPTSENLLRAIEDFQGAAGIATSGNDPETIPRAEQKRMQAFGLANNGEKIHWKAPFLDVLLYYQIYGDWDEVGKLLGDAEGVKYLAPYVSEWIAREFIPEDYRFKYQPKKAEGSVQSLFQKLEAGMDALAIHNAVFEHAKTNEIEPKELFKQIYLALIERKKDQGSGNWFTRLTWRELKRTFCECVAWPR